MSVPTSMSYPPPAMPHGRAGPRTNAARIHAVVAVSVISTLGTLGVVLGFFAGIFVADACHEPGDLACRPAVSAFLAFGSVPAVLAGLALAIVGLTRSARGGGHLPTVAAWVVWGGYCLAWWVVLGLAT